MTDRELMEMALSALELTEQPRYFSQREAIRRLQRRLERREWENLTEDEFFKLLQFHKELDSVSVPVLADLIRTVQAKLKEKNA